MSPQAFLALSAALSAMLVILWLAGGFAAVLVAAALVDLAVSGLQKRTARQSAPVGIEQDRR